MELLFVLFVVEIEEHGVSLGSGDVLENVAWLAFKNLAQHVERGETDRLDFAGFDARQVHVSDSHFVGEIVERNMSIGHNLVEMENDRHLNPPRASRPRVLGEGHHI